MDIRSEASIIETGSSATISFGLGDQRARHRDALQLPAGQFVGKAALDLGHGQPDALQRLVGDVVPRCAMPAPAKRWAVANRYSSIRLSGLKASNGFWNTG